MSAKRQSKKRTDWLRGGCTCFFDIFLILDVLLITWYCKPFCLHRKQRSVGNVGWRERGWCRWNG